MFWVIFDTSTRRDYYRDVHNLLALPPGSTIRYDYGQYHVSQAAIEEAAKGDAYSRRVLVAYAQAKSFGKGDADPRGVIAYDQGLWIGTRIANLRHLRFSVNRYYFDLELREYPVNDAAFAVIMQALAAAQETPFAKWVGLSNQDGHFDSLTSGTTSDNWASIVNRIGTFPSQFAGDSFWRIANVASGARRSSIQPVMRNQAETADKEVNTGVEAVYPIFELGKLALRIESRTPEAGEELGDKEPEAARTITFQTPPDGPLKDVNGRTLTLRRYASEWVEMEVGGSDRIDVQLCDVTIRTGPAVGAYPIGPELTLRFQVSKYPGSWHRALLSAVLSAICGAVGTALLKDHVLWGSFLIVSGVMFGVLAYYLWSGKVKLPGGK